MASINTIPIELLHRIVDLTVEDAIALRRGGDKHKQERLRRNILIRLALVSKDFTRPAQLALWRYMNRDHILRVDGLIEAGFGKDKVIEELDIHINLEVRDGHERFNKLISFLRGVKKVINITRLTLYNAESPVDVFFEIDSIQELKSIGLHNFYAIELLVSPQTRLPSNLRHLTIFGFSKGIDDLVSRLIESSSSTLACIELIIINPNEYFGSKLSSVLPSLGPRLQKLEVKDCDDSILSSLIPHCTSLKSLSIYSSIAESWKFVVDTLGTIPQSVILESFSIALPPRSKLVDFPDFVQLLETSPFSQLKRLNLALIGFYVNAPPQELVGFVRENDDLMELLENRGTILEFGMEEDVRLKAEKEKQRICKERQEKLDLCSKEEEDVAE